MISFFDLPGTDNIRLSVLDVGAMNLGEEVYAPLLRARRASVLGFEPVPEECEKLNARGDYSPLSAVCRWRRQAAQVPHLQLPNDQFSVHSEHGIARPVPESR